jgi:transposase-like protein
LLALVLIPDMNFTQGLLKAVKELIPNAEHRMCARHIYANWRKKYTSKKLQKKWWRCAKPTGEKTHGEDSRE